MQSSDSHFSHFNSHLRPSAARLPQSTPRAFVFLTSVSMDRFAEQQSVPQQAAERLIASTAEADANDPPSQEHIDMYEDQDGYLRVLRSKALLYYENP